MGVSIKNLGIAILLSVVFGIIIQTIFNFTITIIVLGAVVGLMLTIVARRFLFIVIAALSAINVSLHTPMELPSSGRDITFTGIVVGEEHYEKYLKLSVNIEKALLKDDTIAYNLPVDFYTYKRETFLGKRLIIKGRVRPAKFLHRPNILVGDIIKTSLSQNPMDKISHTIRKYIARLLRSTFDGEHYKIASGLILGGSNRLGKDLKEVFSRAGILHILAVSGLHVGFVCLFISSILLFIPISSRVKFILVMFFLFIYAGVVGFRPSICRATLMAFLFGLALILQRDVDGVHIINITAIIFLLINPLLLFNVGAQLSFAAVYGIVFLYPRIEKAVIRKVTNRYLKIIYASMVISFSAQLFVSPLLIYYFHRLPTLAVFSNLIIVPIAAITIYLLFSCLLCGLFSSLLAEIIAFPISQLLTVLIVVSKFFADLSFSAVSLSASPLLLVLFYFLFPQRLRKSGIIALFIVATIFSVSSYSNSAVIKIVKDGTLISTANGETIFITLKGKTNLLNVAGINEVDYLIAPRRLYPVRKDFFEIPAKLHVKKIHVGDMYIEIQNNQRIKYHNLEIDIREFIPKKGSILYVITDGKNLYEFKAVLYKSIIDQIIVDIKIIFAKLKFLI